MPEGFGKVGVQKMSFETRIKKVLDKGWVCTKCGNLNPRFKPDRKREEVQKNCRKCGKKKEPRAF